MPYLWNMRKGSWNTTEVIAHTSKRLDLSQPGPRTGEEEAAQDRRPAPAVETSTGTSGTTSSMPSWQRSLDNFINLTTSASDKKTVVLAFAARFYVTQSDRGHLEFGILSALAIPEIPRPHSCGIPAQRLSFRNYSTMTSPSSCRTVYWIGLRQASSTACPKCVPNAQHVRAGRPQHPPQYLSEKSTAHARDQ